MLLRLDGAMEAAAPADKEEVYRRETHKRFADIEALSYVGMQRAFRALGIKTQGDLNRVSKSTLMKMTALWMEGFVVGAEYGDGNRLAATHALRTMLDGYDALVDEDIFDPLEAAADEASKLIAGEGE